MNLKFYDEFDFSNCLEGNSDGRIYRGLVARASNLTQDRSDIGVAVKELCRDMSAPIVASWANLKKFGRYLRSHPRLVIHFDYQDVVGALDVYADTDYAGRRRTRRSTNGGCAM